MNWTKESLKNKRATIDMKCSDAETFKWAVTRSLNSITKNSERVAKSLREQSEKYNWDGILFPTPLEQIEIFEKNNDLLINVFGLNEEKTFLQTLKMFRGDHVGRVPLVLMDGRYLVVRSMSRLLHGQNTKRRCKRFYCNSCLKGFSSEGKLDRHIALGCDFEQTKKPKVECDFCSECGESKCHLHLDLSEVSGDDLVYNKEIRKDILDPKRTQDILLVVNENIIYKAILEGDEWVFAHVGKKENTKIVALDESGRRVGVEHACRECVVGGSNCGCLTKDDFCDLCLRQGRHFCPSHSESADPREMVFAKVVRESAKKLGEEGFVSMAVRGEMFKVVFREGRLLCNYVGKASGDIPISGYAFTISK